MIQFFNKKMSKKRKGFTLIELVVVVAILGILLAIAIPRFTSFNDSAAKRAVEADARSVYSAFEVYNAENGSYPADAPALETVMAVPAGSTINYAPGGTVLFTYTKTVNSKAWLVEVSTSGVVGEASPTT